MMLENHGQMAQWVETAEDPCETHILEHKNKNTPESCPVF